MCTHYIHVGRPISEDWAGHVNEGRIEAQKWAELKGVDRSYELGLTCGPGPIKDAGPVKQ